MSSENKNISLKAQLSALERDSAYSVVELISKTPHTKTEKVMLRAAGGVELGPFIRKEFSTQNTKTNAYKRIFDEQKKLRRLNCVPHVMACYEYGQVCVVILEYVEGTSLDAYVKQNNLSISEIASLFTEICEAVDQLHTHFETPLIHRDIKPSNIIVNTGRIMLIDFGIARFYRNDANPDTTKLGTAAFAPPEQYGFGQTCIQSDVYALGMVLYFMLTKNVSNTTLRDNPAFKKSVPKNLQRVLLRATSFDPKSRYLSAKELAQSFNQAALGSTTPPKTLQNAQYIDTTPNTAKRMFFEIKENFRAGKYAKIQWVIGRIFNAILAIAWLGLMAACIAFTFFPQGSMTNLNHATRVVKYLGIGGTFFTTCAFLLWNKALLKRKFTWAKHLNWKTYFFVTIAAIALLAIFTYVSNAIS